MEQMVVGLKDLDREEFLRFQEEIGQRLCGFDGEPPISGVVEYRPYADGMLQAEGCRYYCKNDTASERRPYWYFRYHEGGKQKKLYLGRTDNPEGEVVWKRAEVRGRNKLP